MNVQIDPFTGLPIISKNNTESFGGGGGITVDNGAVHNTDTSTASMSFVVDEDAMTSDSATKVPTQQSVKAYVDNSISTIIDYNLIDNLPSIKYIAHRGGSSVMPEETMGAFRMARSVGAHMIECDVWTLADGSLGLMHDSTVTRTTDGTGNIANYDAVNVKSLDASDVWPNGYENETVPLFTDVLDEFGGKIIICPEPKDSNSLQKMIDLVVARKLQRSIIFQAVSDAQITTIVSNGCVCVRVYTSEPTTPNIATAVSNGASYLCGNGSTFSQAKLQEMVAALPTWCYTINRRVERDVLLGYGITGFMTDQPAYLARTTAIRTSDSWRYNVLGHGLDTKGYYYPMQELMLTGGFEIIKNGSLRMVSSVNTTYYFLIGEVSPLANASGTYTIDYDVQMESGTPSGAGMGLLIAMDDGDYRNYSSYYGNGWLIYMRDSGIYTTFKTTAPSTASASGGFTLSGATYTPGQWIHMKVEVTSTTIKTTATNTTTGGTGTVTVTDSAFRGGYIYVGKTSSPNTVSFNNLVIT